MKRLVIMRGLPGAGKSYVTRELHSILRNQNPLRVANFVRANADYFFELTKLPFSAHLLPLAHGYSLGVAAKSMQQGASWVVVDNTNTRKWEYAAYTDIAKAFGYQVRYVRVLTPPHDCVKFCEHKVPEEKILEMEARYEVEPSEYIFVPREESVEDLHLWLENPKYDD